MPTLINNLNSDLFQAMNVLRGSKTKNIVKVYVESDDDIAHWNRVFAKTVTSDIIFEITLPVSEGYTKGKIGVIDLIKDNLGPYFIACVDSDYDYLIPDLNDYSKIINTNEFIFQTYTYSIENLYAHHTGLKNFCIDCLKRTDLSIDMSDLVLEYSRRIYELFCWNVYFYTIGMEKEFSISEFTSITKILKNEDVLNNFKDSFTCLNYRIDTKITELKKKFNFLLDDLQRFQNTLRLKGVNENNCYLYAQGHLILENVVLMFLKPILKHEKSRHIAKIKEAPIAQKQKINEINHYESKVFDLKNIQQFILSHLYFFNSEEFIKTSLEINAYFKKHLSKN